jgi:putative transposon-encoded protein
VKSWVLRTLGMLAEYFPDTMADKSSQLFRMYCDFLKFQFEKNKPDFQIISGVIKGITSMLIKFSKDFISDKKNVETVYKYTVLGALNPPATLKKYDIPKGKIGFRVFIFFSGDEVDRFALGYF